MEAVTGSFGDLGGAVGGVALPLGTNDLTPTAPQAAGPSLPVPNSPF